MMNSFIYMFEDKNFIKKFFVVFFIILIANLCINWSGTLAPSLNNYQTSVWYYILFLSGLVILCIPYGYSITVLQSKLQKDNDNNLPSINLVKNFIDGFKVVLSGAILVIAVLFLLYLIAFPINLITGALQIFCTTILYAMIFFIIFFVSFLFIAMCCRYVVKPSFLNFMNFKAAIKLINSNVASYFKSYLLTILSVVVAYLITFLSVSVLTKIGYIGLLIYCIVVSLIWTYQIYLFAGLFSKAVNSENIQ